MGVKKPFKDVNPEAYDEKYYLGGYSVEEFMQRQDDVAKSDRARLEKTFTLADQKVGIKPGKVILDVGCGRGELLVRCAQRGARIIGFDLSDTALKISKQMVALFLDAHQRKHVEILRTRASRLPFTNSSFDILFMADIVEHLNPTALTDALKEAHRVLKQGGYLIIHTQPNRWAYNIGSPLNRLAKNLFLGERLPLKQARREDELLLHINEQSPVSLAKVLRETRFRYKLSMEEIPTRSTSQIRSLILRLKNRFPFNMVFSPGIYVAGRKL